MLQLNFIAVSGVAVTHWPFGERASGCSLHQRPASRQSSKQTALACSGLPHHSASQQPSTRCPYTAHLLLLLLSCCRFITLPQLVQPKLPQSFPACQGFILNGGAVVDDGSRRRPIRPAWLYKMSKGQRKVKRGQRKCDGCESC